ncbi:hypothetical protein MJK70_23530 [Klebsiella pneumoniae]|nr:hypothetical protein MJK70_23530 [Klebsiella pneumoniae]
MAEGTEVSVDKPDSFTLRQDVARGHKFALTDYRKRGQCHQIWPADWLCIGGYCGRCSRSRPQYAHESERSGSVSLST